MYYCDIKTGRVYRDGGAKLHTRTSYLGFGGTNWRITLADGTVTVSNNLWAEFDEATAALAVQATLETITRRELAEGLGVCWRCDGTGKFGYRYCPECNSDGSFSGCNAAAKQTA